MNEVRIRQATDQDLVGLTASSAALFAEDGAARDHLRNPLWPQAYGPRWCAGLIAEPSSLALVATGSDDVVGHLIGTCASASTMWTAPRAQIVSTFVSTPWRGQGLGSRLVAECVSWAKSRGALRAAVSAYASNTDAVRFYRQHSFVPLSLDLALEL